jgi:virulence factor Mce-like protein
MSSARGRVVRRRLQGLAFLVVLAVLLGLAVATYEKTFSTVAHVTLRTGTIGNQLEEASDVKVRGVIVGEVRAVHAGLRSATIDLAVDPQYLPQIPANVTALLLPKTLFGERYVSLTIPAAPSAERLHDGEVIGEDRSSSAIELQRVVDDLLPLLRAVQPQDLSYTLGAVASALRGRGDALGENLVRTGSYVGGLNEVLPQLEADIPRLADFADTYDSAAGDLLGVLDDLSVTNRTVVDQQEQLRRTFTVVDSSSDTLAGFLATNEQNLISLAKTSEPVLGVFARYSPEYPCLLNGLARFDPMISSAFGAPGSPYLRLNITVNFPQRNAYQPGDQPAYAANSGPSCRGLTNIDAIIAAAQRGTYYCPAPAPDGVRSPDNPSGDPQCLGGSGTAPSSGAQAGQSLPTSLVGSTSELDFVKSILGHQTGEAPEEVPDLAAATLAPVLRGTTVDLP